MADALVQQLQASVNAARRWPAAARQLLVRDALAVVCGLRAVAMFDYLPPGGAAAEAQLLQALAPLRQMQGFQGAGGCSGAACAPHVMRPGCTAPHHLTWPFSPPSLLICLAACCSISHHAGLLLHLDGCLYLADLALLCRSCAARLVQGGPFPLAVEFGSGAPAWAGADAVQVGCWLRACRD